MCKYDGVWSLEYDFNYVDRKRSILKITINEHENITINKDEYNCTCLNYLNFRIKIKNGDIFVYKQEYFPFNKLIYRFNHEIREPLIELDGIKYMVFRNAYSASYYIIKTGSILLNNVYEDYDASKEFLYIFLKDVEYLLVLRYDMINDICYIENTPIMFFNNEVKDDLFWLIYVSKKLDIL